MQPVVRNKWAALGQERGSSGCLNTAGIVAKYPNMVSASLRFVIYQGAEGNLGQFNM